MIRLEHKPLDMLHETSKFGFRDYEGMWWHNGCDLRAEKGTPVYAVADGTVIAAKDGGTYGLYIAIDHGKFGSLYAHLTAFNVIMGQKVKAGDYIGLTGNSGTEAFHLHFELRDCEVTDFWDRCKYDKTVFMRCVDPYPYLFDLVVRETLTVADAKIKIK